MAVSTEGIGQVRITVKCNPEMTAGVPCYVDGESFVDICADGSEFVGIVDHVEGSLASVIIRGVVTVSYSGTFPGYGLVSLAGDGLGGVKAYADGEKYTVLSADRTKQTINILL